MSQVSSQDPTPSSLSLNNHSAHTSIWSYLLYIKFIMGITWQKSLRKFKMLLRKLGYMLEF